MRYVDNDNHPQERVLEIKETTDKTGEGQAKEILKSLEGNCMAAGKIDVVKSDMFGARVSSKIPLTNIEVTL